MFHFVIIIYYEFFWRVYDVNALWNNNKQSQAEENWILLCWSLKWKRREFAYFFFEHFILDFEDIQYKKICTRVVGECAEITKRLKQ